MTDDAARKPFEPLTGRLVELYGGPMDGEHHWLDNRSHALCVPGGAYRVPNSLATVARWEAY